MSRQTLQGELEVSRATLMRDITTLRDQLNMPIAFDREAEGYVLAKRGQRDGLRYELPGVWLTGAQAMGVLTLVNVTMAIDPGILRSTLEPLRRLVKQIAGLEFEHPPPIDEKLSIEIASKEGYRPEIFKAISVGLYEDLEVDLKLVGNEAAWTHCTLWRYALTQEGWYIDVYHEAAGKIVRVPMELIESVRIRDRPSRQSKRRLVEYEKELFGQPHILPDPD